jgi:acyl carrier protein
MNENENTSSAPDDVSLEQWILAKFGEVLRRNVDDLSLSTQLGVDVDADSVDIVEVANAAEDHFGVVLDEDALLDVSRIGDLLALVSAELSSR